MELWSIISDIIVGLMTVVGGIYIAKATQIKKNYEDIRKEVSILSSEHERVKEDIEELKLNEKECKSGIYERLNNQNNISISNQTDLKNISNTLKEMSDSIKPLIEKFIGLDRVVGQHDVKLSNIDKQIEKIVFDKDFDKQMTKLK
jgi:hypothetical protein